MAIDAEEIDKLLRRHRELVDERAPREALWRKCEKWVDPYQQGGFWKTSPGLQRDQHITDTTAITGLETFTAAIQAMLLPEGEEVTTLETTDPNLNAMPKVQVWLAQAADRLHACRNAPHTGFATHSPLRWRQLGVYGTAGFWVDEVVGRGLCYRSIHLSELFIDDDYRGVIDTVHRRFSATARQVAQMFHDDNLPPKVLAALNNAKLDQNFTVIHIVRPNSHWEPGRMGIDGFPVQSLFLIEEDKALVSASGYHTPPLAVSRYTLAPGDRYGIGPAAMMLGTITQLNVMTRDLVRATHLALNPPVLVPEGGSFNRQSMTPGAGIPGGMEGGRRQMEPFMAGANVQYTKDTFNDYREAVKAAFLTNAFAIMNEPIDRQTATEFMGRKREAMALQAPNVGRQLAEMLTPQVMREMDILLRAKQIPPPPQELIEARAGLKISFDNPLTRAAASSDAHNFMSGLQALEPMAQIDASVFDVIDTDAAPRGVMLALGVRADWLADPDAVAAKRQQRASAQQGDQLATAAPALSKAALNIAQARSLAPAEGAV